MPRFQLEVYYEVEGLRVRADSLGAIVTAHDKDGVTVRVDLPEASDSFTIPNFRSQLNVEGHDPDPREQVTVGAALLRSGDKYEIRIVRAVANTDGETFQQVRDRLLESTRVAVTNLTEWVWVRNGQVWNAPSGEYPKQISPVSYVNLDDSTGGTELNPPTLPIRVVPLSSAVSSENFAELGRLCVDQGRPTLPDLLLAEGRHHLWRHERLAPDRAVLMAAMACELAIRTALRELSDPADLLWVDLVVKNPRDVSVTAANLWHQAMKAATGRSLSEDDSALFRRLEKLIKRRNGIVHSGESVNLSEATDLVGAAVEAFDWLRTIDHGRDP